MIAQYDTFVDTIVNMSRSGLVIGKL